MGQALHRDDVTVNEPAEFVCKDVPAADVAEYIASMLYGLEAMAVSKRFGPLAQLLRSAQAEAKSLL